MALIKYVSGSGVGNYFGGVDTSVSNTFSHTASGTDRLVVVYAGLSTADSAQASTAVTATYGGVSMTLQGMAQVQTSGGSGDGRFATFTLLNPATGAQNVVVTYTNLLVTFANKQLTTAAVSYRNVRAVEGFVKTTDNLASATTGSVTGTSTGCGDFLVFGHMRIDGAAFSSYNQTQRYTVAEATYCRLLAGDNASGDVGSVTSTATASASDWQAASALRLKRVANADFFAALL